MKRFDARNVIVTGAGSGIGAATVKRLLDEGATVVAVDVTQAGVDAVTATAADPSRVHGAVLDVCDHDAAIALVSEMRKRLGSLYGLINCANGNLMQLPVTFVMSRVSFFQLRVLI